MKKYTEKELAFIGGTELAIDWNLPIPEEDYEEYLKLIKDESRDKI